LRQNESWQRSREGERLAGGWTRVRGVSRPTIQGRIVEVGKCTSSNMGEKYKETKKKTPLKRDSGAQSRRKRGYKSEKDMVSSAERGGLYTEGGYCIDGKEEKK